MPPVQFPEAHSPVAVQVSPFFFLHAPAVSHVFVPEHVAPDVSSALDTVTLQAPSTPQFRHSRQLACAQHVPSRQLPDVQSIAELQACPCFFLHVAATSQVLLPAQVSGSSEFVIGSQVPPVPVHAWQVPQNCEQQRLSVQFAEAHSPERAQAWPGFFLQVPAASHVLLPAQVSVSSVLVIVTQVPPAPVQVWHVSQVCMQQRLSVQAPVVHSPAAEQASPFFLLHVPAASQMLVPAQVAPVVSSAPKM